MDVYVLQCSMAVVVAARQMLGALYSLDNQSSQLTQIRINGAYSVPVIQRLLLSAVLLLRTHEPQLQVMR